jgi:hypothetical protein
MTLMSFNFKFFLFREPEALSMVRLRVPTQMYGHHRGEFMRRQLLSGSIALLLLGGGGSSLAEDSSGGAQATKPSQNTGTTSQNDQQLKLNEAQGRTVVQGVGSEHAQAAPSGFDGQVGTKVPDSMNAHALPSEVTAQVPQTKGLLFLRLPDRVLLIDPDEKKVIEIVGDASKNDAGGLQ